jgi:hypothetical protein
MIHPLIDVNKWVLYDTVAAALLTVFDKWWKTKISWLSNCDT